MKLLDKNLFFSRGLELEEITAADKGESQFSEELMSRVEFEFDAFDAFCQDTEDESEDEVEVVPSRYLCQILN